MTARTMAARPTTPTPVTGLTWRQVLAFRLRRHLLATGPADDDPPGADLPGADLPGDGVPAAVASRLCGLHAQVASSAELAAAVRGAADVTGALGRRELVKTWLMRGTLHAFSATDLPLFVAAGQTRRGHLSESWLRYQTISRGELDAIVAAVPQALAGRELTRDELAVRVAELVGVPELAEKLRSGWGDLLKPSALRGDLCFGAGRGRNVTFVRPRDWVAGPWPSIEPPDALREVARRYLATYGPATREDFARWWGCQPAEAGRTLTLLGDEVVPVEVDGWAALALRADLDEIAAARPAPGQIQLLPGFDPYVVGACPRAHPALLPDGRKDDIYRAQGWVSAVVLREGRMVGVWRWQAEASTITVTPFVALDQRARAAVAARATRVARLLGADHPRLTWAAT